MNKCNFFAGNELDANRQIDILYKKWNYILKVSFMKVPLIMDLYVYMGIQTSESDVVIDKIEWSQLEKVHPYEVTFKMDKKMDNEQIIEYIKSKLANV